MRISRIISEIPPRSILLWLILFQVAYTCFGYLVLNASNAESSEGFMPIIWTYDAAYFVCMLGLYFYSKQNAYRACLIVFILHIWLYWTVPLPPYDSDSFYGAVFLILAYLANLQAHAYRRRDAAALV